ncbi:MAG: hypothetical protein H0U95_02095 [Bacteroidetes bacterium]|nr:hypothetical protein [Bacteroidota bacterium]
MKDKEDQEHVEKDKKDPIKILLADDDKDDQHLFKEALEHTDVPTELTTESNGQDLMDNLHDPEIPNPDIIFWILICRVRTAKNVLKKLKPMKILKIFQL